MDQCPIGWPSQCGDILHLKRGNVRLQRLQRHKSSPTNNTTANQLICVVFRCLMNKPPSPLVVPLQLAGAAGAGDDGKSGEQKQQPAEEEAALAQAGHPNHPADAGRLSSPHPGDADTCKY